MSETEKDETGQAVFEWAQKVMFRHCDPAGIVFFPRYFEMMNDCIETFFEEVAGWPFQVMHGESAVPVRAISTEFVAPSRNGDRLTIAMRVTRIGRSSMSYRMIARADDSGERRFETEATIVHIGADGRAHPWPDEVRGTIETWRQSER